MKLDLTITVTAILGISAILSPILTAIINNHYQLKVKNLELKQLHFEQTILYKRNIYENYLKFTGRFIRRPDVDASKSYGEYYFLALTYAPKDVEDAIIQLNHLISNSNFDNATTLFEERVAPLIRTMLQKL